MKLPEIVEVCWDDHQFLYGDGVVTSDLALQYTIGYLVRENSKIIELALTWADDKPSERQIIDKRMVREIWRVRPEEKT